MDYVPSGKMGLLILTHAGQLAYISRQAQYLLWQANHDTALPDQPRPFTDRIDLPPALLRLCRRLDRNRQTLDKPLMCYTPTPVAGLSFAPARYKHPLPVPTWTALIMRQMMGH